MKKSVLGRSAKLLGMASRLATSELGHNIRRSIKSKVEDIAPDLLATRLRQAQVLTENLSQLKGAAMKAGQLLSIDSSDILPEQVTEVLSQLQNSAEPIDFSMIDNLLKTELPTESYWSLQDLDTQAYAAASIGQVHRAHFKGQDIVLKVQYPGVADAIDSDLKILKKVAQAMVAVGGRKIPLDETFEELSVILHQEADYHREMENMIRFYQLLSGSDKYVVPEPIPELCSKHILAMSYVEGQDLKGWIATGPSTENKVRVGKMVLDLYCREFFDWGIVQTDPNYGNFMIQKDPLRLVLLDFGATITYDNEFRASYVRLLKEFASYDRRRMLEAALAFGLLDERESDETQSLFVEFLKSAVEPFLPHLQPFRFHDPGYSAKAHKIGRDFTSSLKYSPPPRQLLFLHRKLGGIFNMLRKMQVELDLTPYWQKMVGEEFLKSTGDRLTGE